jgi:hypothetical protein
MSDPPTGARSSRLPAWLAGGHLRWWLLGALVSIVLVRTLLPWGLARVAESQGSQQMGRIVQVGDLDLELLMGRIALADVVVGPLLERVEDPEAPIDPKRALLSFARLGVELSWGKLLTGELRLVEVSLDSPRVQIIRDEDGNLVPIRVAPPEPDEEEVAEEEPSEPGPPLPIAIDTLRLSGIELLLLDLARERPPIVLEMRELALADLRLERGTVTLGSLDLESPSVTLLRDANFATQFQGAEQEAAEAAEVSEEGPGTPPALRIAHVELARAEFSVVVGEETLLATLRVAADDVSLDEGRRFPLEVELGVAPGELKLAGQAGVIPPSFAGTLTWNGLELGPLLRAALPDAPLSIASGASEGTLEIEALLAGKPEHGESHLTLSGRAAVKGFDAREAQDRLALAWQGVEVVIDRVHAVLPSADVPTRAPEIALASLEVTAPHVRMKRSAATAPAGAPEAAAPPEEEPATAETAPAGEASQPHLTLARLAVSGGVLELDDAAVSPPHRSEFRDITVQATGVSWPDVAFASLKASMLGPRGSAIALQGALEPAAGDLEIEVKELPLPSYSPYAAEAAGYRLEAGTFSLEAKAGIEGQTVKLDSDVHLRNLDVAEVHPGTFGEQFGMSLDLALALLRDPFGGIHLPVNGSFGPEPGAGVSLAPIVAGALRQVLIGAVTAPIKGLGLLIPGAGKRDDGMLLQPVAFAPGALVPSSDAQLPGLAKLLEERPGLALVLRGRSGPEDDRYLATEMLAEAAASGSELPAVGAAKAGFFERRRLVGALEDHAKGDQQALAELDAEDAQRLDRWVAQVEVPDSRREELARTRAKGLGDQLANERGVDKERVRVGDPMEGEPAVVIELAPAG